MAAAQFVPNMPAMNIVLSNIDFTIVGTTAVFRAESIIPKIGDTPYPAFPISDLSGVYDFTEGLKMSFKCDPSSVAESYTVDVDCNYTSVPTEE